MCGDHVITKNIYLHMKSKKLLFIAIILFFQATLLAQEKDLPNQITLWNPYDMQFTPDNKYLVVSSPNDSKIWITQNLECINLPVNYLADENLTDNSWAYLPDSNAFYFHQSDSEDKIYKVNTAGDAFDITGTLGEEKYAGYQFSDPPSYFLTPDILLQIKVDKKYLPYISVRQLGTPEELIHEKIEGKNTLNVANRNFTVLKGDNNIYYLLSFRSSANSENAEAVVTEINLNTKETRVLAKGIQVYVGDNSFTNSKIESLKRSFETPDFIILNLDGFIYAVRKSDGKILENLKLKSLFSDKAEPKICGERDGKLIVASQDWGNERGIVFHTIDFDSQTIIEQIFHFGIDIEWVKDYKIAFSHYGNEFAIAYKWDEDKGYKVAYINAEKMTMLRDKNNTIESFIAEIAEFERLDKIDKENKEKQEQEQMATLVKTPKGTIVAHEWFTFLPNNGETKQGLGLQLNCDASGNITGYYEYQATNRDDNYSVIFNITGHFTGDYSFVINLVSLYNKTNNIEESEITQRTLNFDIYINPETKTDFVIYCRELSGYLKEGSLDKHFFGN